MKDKDSIQLNTVTKSYCVSRSGHEPRPLLAERTKSVRHHQWRSVALRTQGTCSAKLRHRSPKFSALLATFIESQALLILIWTNCKKKAFISWDITRIANRGMGGIGGIGIGVKLLDMVYWSARVCRLLGLSGWATAGGIKYLTGCCFARWWCCDSGCTSSVLALWTFLVCF